MDGILNLNKPRGITSHDVVNRVRRILKIKRVGHAGTLDPLATGVLLVCVGQATRLAEFLVRTEKEYDAVLILGVRTDTQDSSGIVISQVDASRVTSTDVEQVLPKFLGRIQQVPPMVSALHHQGRRLHELAREGVTVEREPRRVEVKSISFSNFREGENPSARLRIVCSKGLYVRTLIADIGDALGVGAHMSELTRTRIDRFRVEDGVTLDALAELSEQGRIGEVAVSMTEALDGMPKLVISEDDVDNIRHGRQVALSQVPDGSLELVAAVTPDGRLACIAQVVDEEGQKQLQPKKVFI